MEHINFIEIDRSGKPHLEITKNRKISKEIDHHKRGIMIENLEKIAINAAFRNIPKIISFLKFVVIALVLIAFTLIGIALWGTDTQNKNVVALIKASKE